MESSLASLLLADSRPRALAALMRSFRDIDMAEDLYQEACLRAAERWVQDGVPRDPTAWLIKVARNAGLDRIRKSSRMSPIDAEAVLEAQSADRDAHTEMAETIDRREYKDDVLRLMFLCCHPELKAHEQLALALKVVVGFSVEEIARAFVVTPDTMQRRLSRAKARAASLAPRFDMPGLAERAVRLNSVQTMIYLLFNEGYRAAHGNEQIRHALCDEAIRLARLLLDLFPSQVELMGLLALCLLQHSRARARIDAAGRLVSLQDQDRSPMGQGQDCRGPHAGRKGAAPRPTGAAAGAGGHRGRPLRGDARGGYRLGGDRAALWRTGGDGAEPCRAPQPCGSGGKASRPRGCARRAEAACQGPATLPAISLGARRALGGEGGSRRGD